MLKPLKIVGQLIGGEYNDAGELVGEEVMGPVAIYAPNFGRVGELVQEALVAAGVPSAPPDPPPAPEADPEARG